MGIYDDMGSYPYNSDGNFSSPPMGLGPLNDPTVPIFIPSARENQVLDPSEMVCMLDAPLWTWWGSIKPVVGFGDLVNAFHGSDNFSSIVDGTISHSRWGWKVPEMNERHVARWKVGFCDGHIESLRPNQLLDQKNSFVMSRWNKDHQPHFDP